MLKIAADIVCLAEVILRTLHGPLFRVPYHDYFRPEVASDVILRMWSEIGIDMHVQVKPFATMQHSHFVAHNNKNTNESVSLLMDLTK